MVWFRVDDGLPQSIKILSIPRAERAAAVGLWTLAGAWAEGELTDGFVPNYVISDLPAGDSHRDYLIAAKLWSPVTHPVTQERGIQFHDWSEYQPAKVDVMAVRARHAANQRAYRERKREEWLTRNRDRSPPNNEPVSDYVPTQTRPRPDPDRSSSGTTWGLRTPRTRPKSTATKRAEDLAAIVEEIEAEQAARNGAPKQIGS